VVPGIEPSKEGCSLRNTPDKTRKDIHSNRCANHNIETQEIWKNNPMWLFQKFITTITESKDFDIVEMLDREFKNLDLKNDQLPQKGFK
jgi:hypothetical protein